MKSTASSMLPKSNLSRTELVWEQPLGTIRGHLDEPAPRFVDPYQAEERKAIQEVENMMPPLTGKVFR